LFDPISQIAGLLLRSLTIPVTPSGLRIRAIAVSALANPDQGNNTTPPAIHHD
jgi:hypothetical protein